MAVSKESGRACLSSAKPKERGQALLVVVLVMVVALTVGLSLSARSIISIRTSSEEADSQKALAAAEAGIEQALLVNKTDKIPLTTFIENNTTYSTEITEVKGTAFLANGGDLVLQDDGVDVWLVSHNPDGTPDYTNPWTGKLNIYWGDPLLVDCDNAAIELGIILGPKSSPKLERYAYDPCSSRNNKFDNVAAAGPYTIVGKQFKYKQKANKTGGDITSGLVFRVVPIYTSSAIAVESLDGPLPTQGFSIDSTGTSGTGDRQVLRSISFFKAYNQLATPYFMYGLFSP